MSSIPSFHEVASLARRIHFHDGDTYVSFNTINNPHPPGIEPFAFKYPNQCHARTQWFSEKYPFMGFCMVEPSWNGLFSSLSGTKHSFPLRNVDGLYALSEDLQQSWWRLEKSIIGITQHILDRYDKIPHPLDMFVYRFPHSWGYLRAHESIEAARIRILNSRDAFVPLMALFTYAIAISMTHTQLPDGKTPFWVQYLDSTTRVDSEWISQLAQHAFSNPVFVRVGVYIDWPTFKYTNILQYLVRFRVQVWIRLRGPPPHSFDNMLPVLQVTQADFLEARALFIQQRNAPVVRPVRVLRADQNNTPRTRQLPGETLKSFFERQTNELMRKVLVETSDERVARFGRNLTALAFQCPGQRGAYVFEWQETPCGLKRVYIPRDQVPELWESYSNTQKVYNGIHNEWDLCRQFDPYAIDGSDEDEDEDEDEDIPAVYPDANLQTPEIDILTRTIIHHTYPLSNPVSTTDLQIPSIEDVLYTTYGFHPDGRAYEAPKLCLAATRIPRILVETGFSVGSTRLSPAIHFISTLVEGHSRIPAALHDLNPNNAERLAVRADLTWEKIGDGLYSVRHLDSSDVRLYFPSSTHVVQTFRIPQCVRLRDIALSFGSKGSQFYFGELDNGKNPFTSTSTLVSGLGFRRPGFNPNAMDYQAYVSRRAQYLSDPAVARAALMEGGIIWRLTVDTIFEIHGTVDFSRYLDEAHESVHLSEHDLAVIVGLYRVWTGDSNIDKYLSWWPQRHTWTRGGYNVGHWTSACEDWYQNRIRGLQSSSYNAKGATEWEKSFNLFKQTRQLRKNNEQACDTFLSSVGS